MRTHFARRCLLIVASALAAYSRLVTAVQAENDASAAAVTFRENESSFTLANGIIAAQVSKRSGDLTSLQFKGLEILTDKSGHAGGYWSHDTTGGKETITRITIDPRENSGSR